MTVEKDEKRETAWKNVEHWAAEGCSQATCLLDLREWLRKLTVGLEQQSRVEGRAWKGEAMKKCMALALLVFALAGCTIMDQAAGFVKDQGREWVNDPVKVADGRVKFMVKAGEAYDAAIEKARVLLNEEEAKAEEEK